MIFEKAEPLAAGYFQCDRDRRRPHYDWHNEAGLLYIAGGTGEWSVGPWRFPVQRGDLVALPQGVASSAHLNEGEPFGYYYAFFKAGAEAGEADGKPALAWPWSMGHDELLRQLHRPPAPRAPGAFCGEIAGYFRRMQDELGRRGPEAMLAARAQLALLGVTFARALARHLLEGEGSAPLQAAARATQADRKRMPEGVAQAVEFVLNNLDRELSLIDLVRVGRYSERRFVQLFREALGCSPMAFVRACRIREAQRLLAPAGTERLSVKEVAGRLGFNDPQYFSRVFRQETGLTPTAFASGEVPPRQPEAPSTRFVRAYRPSGRYHPAEQQG